MAEESVAHVGLSVDERIEGFVRLWSEVKYNFVFFDRLPDLNWDEVLAEYLPLVRQEQSDYEYYRLLTKCLAQLQDGHTSVGAGGVLPIPPDLQDYPPIHIQPVEGKAVVVELVETDEIQRAGIKRGMEVTHVDGRTVPAVLEQDLYPYICASAPQARDMGAYAMLLDGRRGTTVSVGIRDLTGTSHTVSLTRDHGGVALPWYNRPVPTLRELPDGVVYVPLLSFGSEGVVKQFDEAFDRISKARGLIIDVRMNGGGNSSFAMAIAGYLTDKPLRATWWKTRQYMPSFRAWGEAERWYAAWAQGVEPVDGRKPYLGPVVVLIGPGTCSSAEDFLIPLHSTRRATLVGQRTNGSTGQPLLVELPGGVTARICTKWDAYPDGREFVGVGVIPDVEVYPTQREIADGLWADENDPIFQKGIAVLRSQMPG